MFWSLLQRMDLYKELDVLYRETELLIRLPTFWLMTDSLCLDRGDVSNLATNLRDLELEGEESFLSFLCRRSRDIKLLADGK
ncbi:hypothetical protein OGAPHI_004802 [Ogataea philodendri]|uniref:Uncharacterized protein n=1 Tax=Ogataea philodendri TaxID=1378263 RepID=A0A9P8P1I1_9ASCO|nr:uncharacterized protein OGAPHI_004802 [Ogataea philodendri]KAH3664088.1 hypothetical protein OGAPHI_004802 [Ogataea philodendri]